MFKLLKDLKLKMIVLRISRSEYKFRKSWKCSLYTISNFDRPPVLLEIILLFYWFKHKGTIKITICYFPGTMTLSKYKQFSGTIQVLKAVNDHLVLNFCQEGISGKSAQLYSVLFSREPGVMERWELDSVHSMLQNKKLSIASRRMVCGNSAEKNVGSVVSSLIVFLVAYTIGLS